MTKARSGNIGAGSVCCQNIFFDKVGGFSEQRPLQPKTAYMRIVLFVS